MIRAPAPMGKESLRMYIRPGNHVSKLSILKRRGDIQKSHCLKRGSERIDGGSIGDVSSRRERSRRNGQAGSCVPAQQDRMDQNRRRSHHFDAGAGTAARESR